MGHADVLAAALSDTVRHFDLKQIALFAWMPFLAADLGSMFGGVVSLWLQKHAGVELINARAARSPSARC